MSMGCLALIMIREPVFIEETILILEPFFVLAWNSESYASCGRVIHKLPFVFSFSRLDDHVCHHHLSALSFHWRV